MSSLSVSIGLSIHNGKYYYLSWIPSESGPLIIDYGFQVDDDEMPLDYLFDRVKQYSLNPRFSISLSNNYVKYDFHRTYEKISIDNWNSNIFHDIKFKKSYDSYLYNGHGGTFNIHILKKKRNQIIDKVKKENYTLMNLGVGIFSALEGVRFQYNVANLDEYIILKLSKKRCFELLLIKDGIFSNYAILKKKNLQFEIINFFGQERGRNRLINLMESLFSKKKNLISTKVFYYSISGNKNDINILLNLKSNNLELINPFKGLSFDDNCNKNLNSINASAYSELANIFRGVDV